MGSIRSLAVLLWCSLCSCGESPAPTLDQGVSALRRIVARSGEKLLEGTEEFRFLSLAAPDLLQNGEQLRADFENRFPDEVEIRDTLESLAQLGGTVTRTFTFSVRKPGESVPVYIEGPGRYNEEAFRTLDRVLAIASAVGVRLIVPLIDSHSFWGIWGIAEFAAFEGRTALEFWDDERVRQDFKDFLSYLLNRPNTLTGLRYRDDPAILAWQLGNELDVFIYDNDLHLGKNCQYSEAQERYWSRKIASWSLEMAAHIRAEDPNHLVMEGGGEAEILLDSPFIDVKSEHHYEHWNALAGKPTDLAALERAAWERARAHGKAMIADEFGMGERDTLIALMDEIESNGSSGGLLWSIRGHSRYGGFYHHNEAGTRYNAYHWPGFASADAMDERAVLGALRERAHRIRGLSPTPAPPPPIPAPLLLPIADAWDLRFRGSTGASGYDIERTEGEGGPWVRIGEDIPDGDKRRLLFSDETARPGLRYRYRVRARNASGQSPPSNEVAHQVPLDARLVLEDGEVEGGANGGLALDWRTDPAGGAISLSRAAAPLHAGLFGLGLAYDLGDKSFSGARATLGGPTGDWRGRKALSLWLRPDGSGNWLVLQFREASGEYWEQGIELTGSDPQVWTLFLTDFTQPKWGGRVDGRLDLARIAQLSIYLGKARAGSPASGRLYLDDLELR